MGQGERAKRRSRRGWDCMTDLQAKQFAMTRLNPLELKPCPVCRRLPTIVYSPPGIVNIGIYAAQCFCGKSNNGWSAILRCVDDWNQDVETYINVRLAERLTNLEIDNTVDELIEDYYASDGIESARAVLQQPYPELEPGDGRFHLPVWQDGSRRGWSRD